MFVSDNPAITNLDPAVLSTAFRSTGRGGTETVILTDAIPERLYYAAIKSEDQQSANFGFFAVSSVAPFSQEDEMGDVVAEGFPLGGVAIPDGSPLLQQPGLMFAFVVEPSTVENVVVQTTITHENMGDLLSKISHNQQFAVLNNHRQFIGREFSLYDDSDSGEFEGEVGFRPSDGPDTLRNFVGEEAAGTWLFSTFDTAPGFVGTNDLYRIRITPQSEDLFGGVGIVRTIQAGRWFYTPVEVPADATNLNVCVAPDAGTVSVHIRREDFPTLTEFDAFGVVAPPGSCVNLSLADSPPLSRGRYIVGVFNPNSTEVSVNIRIFVERALVTRSAFGFTSLDEADLFDDATTNSTIFVDRKGTIADLTVGVRIDHDRVSDLVLHLVSPSGTRILLAENRGGTLGTNYGSGILQTNVSAQNATGGPMASTNVIGPVQPVGLVQIQYQFFNVPDELHVYYDGELIFDSGLISGGGNFVVEYGPGLSTNVTIVMNEGGNPNSGTAWDYTATVLSGFTYANFTENTNLARVPIKFAVPPFTVTNGFMNAITPLSGFETVAPGNFTAGMMVDGWTVVTNQVSVIDDPVVANSGDRYLALADGKLTRTLNTLPGREYRLRLAYREPGTADISVDGNVTQLVGDTNWLTTSIPFIAVSNQTSVVLSGDTLSMLFDDFELVTLPDGANYLPEEPLIPFRGEEALGDWRLEIQDNRVGAALNDATLLSWRLNLTFVNTNPPVITLTNGLPYTNCVVGEGFSYFAVNVPASASHATNHLASLNLPPEPLDLLFNQSALPTGRGRSDFLLLQDTTAGFADLWVRGVNEYDDMGMLVATSGQPLLQPGRRYYLAVRNNPANQSPDFTNCFVIRVDFNSVDTNLLNLVTLSNRTCYSTNVAGGGTRYYQFDVASNAVSVAFGLSQLSGNVDLVARRFLPLPDLSFFDYASTQPGTSDELIEVTDFTYQLLPGRWYLGVVNLETNNVAYTLCATQVVANVIHLTDQPFTTNAVMGQVDYYSVDILPNAFRADFIITNNVMGNVDLYVAQNLPFPPGPGNACYQSVGRPPTLESITVTNTALSCPLSPGMWSLAVTNVSPGPAQYAVWVIQYTNPPVNYVTLTNQLAYTAAVPAGLTNFYRFVVDTNALQLEFELFGLTGNADLYVVAAPKPPVPLPGPGNFDYSSTQPGMSSEFIRVLDPDGFFTATNIAPGEWWIAVVNPGATAVGHSIRVTQLRFENEIELLTGTATRDLEPTSSLSHSGADYWAILVEPDDIQVEIEVDAAGDVDLLLKKELPVPVVTNHTYSSSNLGLNRESIVVATNSNPVALTNGQWYATVINQAPGNSTYTIRIIRIKANEVTRLVNGVAQCVVRPAPDGSPKVGTNYYVFNVSTNAMQVLFETFNASADVDLYVTPDLPLTPLSSFPLAMATPDTGEESVIVVTNGTPVSLTPGDWFLAVVNRTNTPVSYCVRATEIFPAEIVRLFDGVTQANSISPPGSTNALSIDYYVFTVSNEVAMVNFETFGADGDVDLYVKRGLPITTLTGFDYSSQAVGLLDEVIAVTTNSAPVPLTPGDWYLAVVNRDTVTVNYLVRATQIYPSQIVRLTDGVTHGDSIGVGPGANGIDYFVFTVSNNAVQVDFETFGTLTNNVDLYVSKDVPLPTEIRFDYASTNGGAAAELISVTPDSMPVPLMAGDWYLTVVNRETNLVTYSVRASQILASSVVRLTNAIPYTNTAAVATIDYYVFAVSNDSARAQFEVLSPSGEVRLAVRQGSLPGLMTFDFLSDNPSTNGELIVVFTNSTPPLAAGDWFLGVINTTGSPLSYTVRALQFTETGTNLTVTGITVTSNSLCIRWENALVGIDYVIVGKATVTDPIWLPATPPITATNSSMTYCLDLPTPFSFFRVVEHTPSTNTPVAAVVASVTNSGGGFTLTWMAPTTARFVVQWSATITSGSWKMFTNIVTSTTGTFTFTDDGTQTGGLGPQRFYRVVAIP